MSTTPRADAADHVPHQAMFLAGATVPAALTWQKVLHSLGTRADAVCFEHELYATASPKPGWSLDTEVDAMCAAVAGAGFGRFHLVGFCAGGASALRFVSRHPERVLSLTAVEPAWTGRTGLSPEEDAFWARLVDVMALPAVERAEAFVATQLGPGAAPPPPLPDPAPAWMAQRPAGLVAFDAAFRTTQLDLSALARFDRPVRIVLGGRSHAMEHRKAERLAGIFPRATLTIYEHAHHFDQEHRRNPDRFAADLIALWEAQSA